MTALRHDLHRLDGSPTTAAGGPPHAAQLAGTLRSRSGLLLGCAAAYAALAIGGMILTDSARAVVAFFAFGAVVAFGGAVLGAAAVAKGLEGRAGASPFALGLGLAVANLGMAAAGALAAYVSTMSFTRGRQIRSFGKVLLPPVEPGDAWTTSERAMSSIDVELDPCDRAVRRALAAQWRENGRTEHASVAAFARLTLDLMALGAPPQLVADANRDALDEIRHAQLCFGLARALDGRAESPGAFSAASRVRSLSSLRTLALGQLAVDSLIDGALHEGVSARILAKLVKRCEVPVIQALLKELAADEGRHARHGWDVALWCLAEGGEPVAQALEGALSALPREMSSPMPDQARDGGWERFGVMGSALEAEEHHAALTYVERRVRAAIFAARGARAVAARLGSSAVA